MKIKQLLAIPALMLAATAAFADECSIVVDSDDMMKFNTDAITVSSSCEKFTVTLNHVGKLPINVMGHNWVLSKASDAQAVAMDGISAGLENQYVKPDDSRVIAFTKMLGGGESDSVTFSVKKLKAGETYKFFCSFPGHVAMMSGTLTLK